MNIDRIKEIQKETAYPDSVSVQQALLKVWNECSQPPASQQMPSETIKGVSLFNELKGITKVELALSDNACVLVSEYLHSKNIKYPIKFEKSDTADMLLEFLGVINRKVKSLSLQEKP